jgi:hypothetical protein
MSGVRPTAAAVAARRDRPAAGPDQPGHHAGFRPEIRKLYYDAARYDTYLDQLGVKFPQLTKPQ